MNQQQYDQKCEIIKNLLNTTYINNTFTHEKYNNIYNNEIKFFTKITINNNTKITVLPNNTWKEIKNNIDTKISNLHKNINNTNECIMCFKNMNARVLCNKCSKIICIPCYIELFKIGQGIIVCPFCNYSVGDTIPTHMMDDCIHDIMTKAGL